MPLFPMFADIKNKNCLVFGGGAVAVRKIKTLLKFGVNIYVYAYEYEDELLAMFETGSIYQAEVTVHFDKEELPPILGMDMIICATNNEVFNHKMAKHCQAMGILVNSATSRKDSTFIFPAVTVRGELVVGISTSGQVPAFTKAVRETVDNALPVWYEDFLPALKKAREQVIKRVGTQKQRQAVMGALTEYGLTHHGEIPDSILVAEIEKSINEDE